MVVALPGLAGPATADAVLAALCRNACLLLDAFDALHRPAPGPPHRARRRVLAALAACLADARASAPPVVAASGTVAPPPFFFFFF